jgi:hypothetical protein
MIFPASPKFAYLIGLPRKIGFYRLKSAGRPETLPIGNARVGRLSSSITEGTFLCLGHESKKFLTKRFPGGKVLCGPYATFLPEIIE